MFRDLNSICKNYTMAKFSIPSKFTVKWVFIFTAFCPFSKNTCSQKFWLAFRKIILMSYWVVEAGAAFCDWSLKIFAPAPHP